MKFSSIHLFCLTLIQVILCKKLIERTEPFKPFISVLSKESLESFTENSKKFLSFVEEDSSKKFEDQAEDKINNISVSIKCFYVDGFNLYNIKNLGLNPLKDTEKCYNTSIDKHTIYYNFCEDIPEDKGCSPSPRTQVKDFTDEKCTNLTQRIGAGNKWTIINEKIEIVLNHEKDSKDIVKYILECDNDTSHTRQTHPILEKSHYKKDMGNGTTETLLYFKTHEACPVGNFYVFYKFLVDYKFIFGIILIVAGLFECILGKKLMKITAFILSCAAVIIIVVFFFMQFIVPAGAKDWIIWIILIIAASIGIYLGYVIAKYDDKILSILVGGVSGFFLGQFLYTLLGYKIDVKPLLVNILFVLISIALLIVIALILRTAIIIFCTSFIGSYAAVRGVSFFTEGFPSEITIIDIISAGEDELLKELLGLSVYIYIVSIICLTGIGIFIQYKINSDDKFKDNDDVEELDD